MIKLLSTLLACLLLVSFAPVPAALPNAIIVRSASPSRVVPRIATIYRVRLAVQTSAPQKQACTFETAQSKLRAEIEDPIGYPYGHVEAWSCTGDGVAVANELAERAAAMQAAAAVYRASHPIAGLK